MADIYGGRWKKIDGLGSGRQSDLFCVVDLSEKEKGVFALKELRDPDERQKFVGEVRALSQFHHPNIIPFIDSSSIEKPEPPFFLVMPIAEGGSLADQERVATMKGNIDGVLSVAKQIASALVAVHAQEIVHRDIKPENILFEGKGDHLWLSDFGICLFRLERDGAAVREMATPEVFAVDVHALGKLMLTLLAGERTEDLEPVASFLKQTSKGAALNDLLTQMICPLKRRLKRMDEVVLALEKVGD